VSALLISHHRFARVGELRQERIRTVVSCRKLTKTRGPCRAWLFGSGSSQQEPRRSLKYVQRLWMSEAELLLPCLIFKSKLWQISYVCKVRGVEEAIEAGVGSTCD
jgi:hypothetical protein